MAALTAERATETKGVEHRQAYKMAPSVTILGGALVMLNSAGLAVKAVAVAGNKHVRGVAIETKTSDASTAAYIGVIECQARVVGVGLAQAQVGSLVYASDDQTVSSTQGANEPIAGILTEFVSATDGWVRITPTVAV